MPSANVAMQEGISETRVSILSLLKRRGPSTIAHVAEHLGLSYEAARQHVRYLASHGWLEGRVDRAARPGGGRPMRWYVLTSAGDHLFEKRYDELSVELIDAVQERFGVEALKELLAKMTDDRVRAWSAPLAGKPLGERLSALKDLYSQDDPFMSTDLRSGLRLIERNCPFLNVATRRPALCSVTVSTLQRLLGVRVVREKRFQAGDGCCVFRVLPDQPVDTRGFRFAFEDQSD